MEPCGERDWADASSARTVCRGTRVCTHLSFRASSRQHHSQPSAASGWPESPIGRGPVAQGEMLWVTRWYWETARPRRDPTAPFAQLPWHQREVSAVPRSPRRQVNHRCLAPPGAGSSHLPAPGSAETPLRVPRQRGAVRQPSPGSCSMGAPGTRGVQAPHGGCWQSMHPGKGLGSDGCPRRAAGAALGGGLDPGGPSPARIQQAGREGQRSRCGCSAGGG